jgi:large subunit ribosomal protein L18
MNNKKVLLTKTTRALRTKRRVRSKVSGTATRPRLSVNRSLREIYAQLIDDQHSCTVVSFSSQQLDAKGQALNKVDQAFEVGKEIAKLAAIISITSAVFDRGGRLYHGRVKRLAEGAREGGLVL